jgi:very-short-patch-repair endonuclease
LNIDSHTGVKRYQPRALSDNSNDNDGEAGFLYFSTENPWPSDEQTAHERLPDDWLEEFQGRTRVRSNRRDSLPRSVWIGTDGVESEDGLACHYIASPFRFCLQCGVSYGFRQTEDFSKLTSLGSEGRSTATTILSLSAITHLRHIEGLDDIAKKLLSFTDNRQDASLQAGHFNDFVEIALLRSAIYHAVSNAGAEGIAHEDLVQKVFTAFNLPFESYASDPELKHQARRETERALREVLGYRIYRDLKRGWRITSPNLEQCGLLEIKYPFLEDVCADEEIWGNAHPALVSASPDTRARISKTLLDFMRRELAIKVNYLDQDYQERILQLSNQRLKEPWAIDENEVGTMSHATSLFPRARARDDYRGNVYLSSRSGFGQFLRRQKTFPYYNERLSLEDTETIIRNILESLRLGGLVEKVDDEEDIPGYQVPADAMQWAEGDGTKAFHDLIRVPNAPQTGGRTNPFFVEFYRSVGSQLINLEAREHTAQVDYELRIEREDDFREGRLPILYCSPTMELGVDIAQLNVVNMRNVPPTPANYAQRSGRAGRGGQPALVFTYCSTGSPHDQYFFKRPELMVAGAVSPPRLDLANEDLIRAHIHAIWLAETGLALGKSLKEILELSDKEHFLELRASIRDQIEAESPRRRARERAERILATIKADLDGCDWYKDRWLEEVLKQVARRFDATCDRWRSLYSSALSQAETQDSIIRDPNRRPEDRRQAERLRREAEAQLKLLIEVENVAQSDFYSYRYFASEGFLPGYNFPRLPISAYIPGRRTKDEFLSRPRFLAISEFGPRSIIYHEGSRYVINKVIIPPPASKDSDTVEQDAAVPWRRAKMCGKCGYLHPISAGEGQDVCERCESQLDVPLQPLFRMQNVSTKRRDRINSDEEERIRLGYELISGVRFTEHDGRISYRTGAIESYGQIIARLSFGHAATLWRINLGWRRRKNRNQLGFVLDTERGYWARNEELAEGDQDDPMSARTMRVIPFVEDTRNCLLFEPSEELTQAQMASLQAALKVAIQVEYQLEDNELAAEPLPSSDERRVILFYESSEGGAGVLRRLLDDSQSFARIAANALTVCHFDPVSGEDKGHAERAKEDCEAACYDCLLSYYNQREHALLDRKLIRDLLFDLAGSQVVASPTAAPLAEHVAELLRLAGSDLEREWLNYLNARGYRLPSKAQAFIERCQTRPDFIYEEQQTLIYIDGPHHLYPDRQQRDTAQTECLEDCGYTVIRFGIEEEWESKIRQYPHIFGVVS